jgi:phospholipase/carboxylesterase
VSHPHGGHPVLRAGLSLAEAPAAVIMIHGRNASARNILELVPLLDRPDRAYLAPEAANHTWYPLSFLSEIQRNEPYLSSALQRVDELVAEVVSSGIDRARIVILGFSQGACLASEFVYRHPLKYGGLVAFSGGLIGPPGTRFDAAGDFAGTPMFFGCSDVDAHIPKARVEESVAALSRMGAAVTERIYPGLGHLISEDEILHARAVLDRQ